MKIRFPYGTTAENNQLLLPEGEISVDIERKALRLHDGITPGGFEVVGQQVHFPPFRGEVSVTTLIRGDDLASLLGLTAGTAQYSEEPWLHFVDPVDGLTKYIAKKPYRYGLSWDALQAVNAVDGSRIETIQGQQYRVRLLKGANSDPYNGTAGFDPEGAHGSEWNRLMYHISGLSFVHPSNTLASEGITEGDWAQYSEADLLTHSSFGNGSYSWCQEVGVNPNSRVVRGSSGVSRLNQGDSTGEVVSRGWRPCLELVED